ncbi:oxidoreductase-like domain-containing protein 1 [Odontomachus brunneus]|uniref:oxidoreductase-like domain-containing protein 1 n=1 Tax=Odontomachus brunneus TaxID=486640 RepID=UPI0013F1C03A|nr:oxidoreductase-like domain-containing protein 1 [Odontomachus brunneus]
MKFALRSSRIVISGLRCYQRSFSVQKDDDKQEVGENNSKEAPVDDLAEPTNCCMSGCANCVWIQYAERLSSTIDSTSDVNLQTAILERVQDPNMKAFLMMELRCRKLIK